MSLRARLVVGVIALAAVGLASADAATYASLRSFLLDRTDRALEAEHRGLDGLLHHRDGRPFGRLGGPAPPRPFGDRMPLRFQDFVQVRASDGTTIFRTTRPLPFGDTPAPSPPRLPRTIRTGDEAASFSAPSVDGHGRWRVRAASEPGSPRLLVVAMPLRDVDSTLHRLLLIELFVTGAVLAAIGALGLWVVRLGLRPLRQIEQTAAAIADGDLARRVERADERTEVGRLGLALNAMLAQIETAFRAREASERRLRRFVADASHELRTPLAAVRAYAELFARGASDRPDDLARAMGGIGRESERMSVLVDDLLLLARLDEGRPLERERVELADVVGDAVETARTVEPERVVVARLEPVAVLGDRDRLRQVVDNLLANVRAHTPVDAPVTVTVGRENGHALLQVSDEGPGMEAEQVERVFERFYRADPSRSRASGGVGLGLSIVAAVAEAHGGTVTAAAEPGRGATFRVTLPLAG